MTRQNTNSSSADAAEKTGGVSLLLLAVERLLSLFECALLILRRAQSERAVPSRPVRSLVFSFVGTYNHSLMAMMSPHSNVPTWASLRLAARPLLFLAREKKNKNIFFSFGAAQK